LFSHRSFHVIFAQALITGMGGFGPLKWDFPIGTAKELPEQAALA
jgi:hypothetical protein